MRCSDCHGAALLASPPAFATAFAATLGAGTSVCITHRMEKQALVGGEDRERSGGCVECADGHQLLRDDGRGRYGVGGVLGARASLTTPPHTSDVKIKLPRRVKFDLSTGEGIRAELRS